MMMKTINKYVNNKYQWQDYVICSLIILNIQKKKKKKKKKKIKRK